MVSRNGISSKNFFVLSLILKKFTNVSNVCCCHQFLYSFYFLWRAWLSHDRFVQIAAKYQSRKIFRLPICTSKCALRPASESECMANDGLPYTVRSKIPPGIYHYQDVIHGETARELWSTDHLLLKPDALPTSLFATVVDNHTLGASHYIGSSSHDFLQLPLYKALQWSPPTWINIGALRLKSGQRVLYNSKAKRNFVRAYSTVDPLSLLNFLLHGYGIRDYDSSHIYTLIEMIERFDVDYLPGKALSLNTYNILKPDSCETEEAESQYSQEDEYFEYLNSIEDLKPVI